ncbi:MAG: hypothetical protein K9M49_08910 [Candidatus Marinimicrobia bacterium]|nr:hypothetical protein [Candidatus Neomarinimicrobiota bacterium]MCF7850428.1 hypothetical protein [Candidatus Neomarinimicrobiota bacterium]MCF7905255.1 hypothetical protein [Candidatus Neomarinimicrobiota bacterium]
MRIVDTNKQQVPPESGEKTNGKSQELTHIKGLVTSIVDGNTFEMSINGGADKRQEIIRIYGMDKPAPSTLSGILAKLELEKKIVGRTLECEIIEKDELDQLIARIPSKYLQSGYSLPKAQD